MDIQWFWISPELVLGLAGMAACWPRCSRRRRARALAAGKAAIDTRARRVRPAEWISVSGVAVAGVLALMVGLHAGPAPRRFTSGAA